MLVPTALSMKLKFPEFKDQDDMTIEFAIEEAQRSVDDTWLEKDQMLAIMYLAGHYLEITIARSETGGGQMIRSETIGRMSITYATPEQPNMKSFDDFTTTMYGTRFLDLARKNFPAVAIV